MKFLFFFKYIYRIALKGASQYREMAQGNVEGEWKCEAKESKIVNICYESSREKNSIVFRAAE